MSEKTIVLRKDGHWYVISSATGDEREILLAILEYAENRKYNIGKDEVLALLDQLGYALDVQQNYGLSA